MLPMVGHEGLRARVADAIDRGALPSSMLLHGPPGGGKERLGVWIAQRLLCASPAPGGEPCGTCQQCSYVLKGAHPDLLWVFPLPKPKDGDLEDDDVFPALAEAIETRLEKRAWPSPAPTDGIYIGMMLELVRRAAFSPSMAARKVILVADAHRMVSQEGSDQAANAFLKVLEEPSAKTSIILTTSSASSLLPTIRSRVVPVRVPALTDGDRRQLQALGVTEEGATNASEAAALLLDAARGDAASRYKAAFRQGSAGARGGFTASLDALVALLHEKSRAASQSGDAHHAAGFARAIAYVENTKNVARQNANPQLLTATLLADIAPFVS